MDRLAQFDGVEVVARGGTKMTVRLRDGLQVDLRVVPAESFGAALQYFTGSKDHNVVLRGLAKSRGLKINEYGVFEVTAEGEKYVAGRTEEEVYATLGLPAFPPEIREARFEFAWAAAGPLPRLVETADLQGDLHMHTTATDGRATLDEMVAAARARGFAYIAITDHSKRVSMANGLDETRLRAQWAEIDRLNATLTDLRVLKGVEVDILERRRTRSDRRLPGRGRLGRGQRPLWPEPKPRADHGPHHRRPGESQRFGDRPSDGPVDQSPRSVRSRFGSGLSGGGGPRQMPGVEFQPGTARSG